MVTSSGGTALITAIGASFWRLQFIEFLWQAWTTVATGVTLAAGTHVVRVVMDADGSGGSVANFNWFKVR
jgi:hypothetical protein